MNTTPENIYESDDIAQINPDWIVASDTLDEAEVFRQMERNRLNPAPEAKSTYAAIVSYVLKNLQREVYEWSLHNFGNQPAHRPLLGVCEESGELCHAHLKGEQKIRGKEEDIKTKKEDAVGDIFIYLMDYCSREGIDFSKALNAAWGEVKDRDWKKFPKNGRES